jgi:hypothetical protein
MSGPTARAEVRRQPDGSYVATDGNGTAPLSKDAAKALLAGLRALYPRLAIRGHIENQGIRRHPPLTVLRLQGTCPVGKLAGECRLEQLAASTAFLCPPPHHHPPGNGKPPPPDPKCPLYESFEDAHYQAVDLVEQTVSKALAK